MKTKTRTANPCPVRWRTGDSSRAIILPPSDRAHWQAPLGDTGPLQYLAWGTRQFGLSPIARRRHEGWVYALVEEGGPTLVRENRSDPIPAGALVVIGPDCAFGWHDELARPCKLLVWMWRQPAHGPLARLPAGAFFRHALQPDEFAELRHLHAATRGEVHRDDAHSSAALTGLQALLETRIARLGDRDPQEDVISRALRWIETHLTTRQPLARLADFLGVSAATVHRLFRERLQTTVRHKIAELRYQEAERLLASGDITIKAVAYRLGYRHPHDFSRAYRNHVGVLPRQQFAGVGAGKSRCHAPARVAGFRAVAA